MYDNSGEPDLLRNQIAAGSTDSVTLLLSERPTDVAGANTGLSEELWARSVCWGLRSLHNEASTERNYEIKCRRNFFTQPTL